MNQEFLGFPIRQGAHDSKLSKIHWKAYLNLQNPHQIIKKKSPENSQFFLRKTAFLEGF